MIKKALILCFVCVLAFQTANAQVTYNLLGKSVTFNGAVTFDGYSSGDGTTKYVMYLDYNPETQTLDFTDLSTYNGAGVEYKRYWIPLADVDSEYFADIDYALSDGYDLYNKSYWNIAFHAKEGKTFKYVEEGDYFTRGTEEGADEITFIVFEDKDEAIKFHAEVVNMFRELK